MSQRIIKFRAWTGEKMIDEIRLEAAHGIRLVSANDLAPHDMSDDKCILMQFTGLLDKNGKEIYEGDVFYIVHKNKYQTPAKASWFEGILYRGENSDDYRSEYNGWIYEHIKGRFVPTFNISVVLKNDPNVTKNSTQEAIIQEDEYMSPLIIDDSVDYYEIIGNIYENPELLSNK